MTSNSEKQLPDAFLRRCIFHHISFPDKDVLEAIALHSIAENLGNSEKAKLTIKHFMEARSRAVEHLPGTAEFVDLFQAAIAEWQRTGNDFEDVLALCSATICKTREDADRINATV